MLGRKQAINLQLNQILDSLLIAFAFWISHSLTYWVRATWFPETGNIPAFDQFFWLMAITVPFTPIVLEFQGYYDNPLHKTVGKSLGQMFRALIIIGVAVGAFVVFLRYPTQSRVVMVVLVFVGGGMLLLKEFIVRHYYIRRAKREGWKERVLLAGVPEDVAKLKDLLEDSKIIDIGITGEIDLSSQPIEDLIDALHSHSVERVIFAAGHVHFEKVQQAITACETEGVEAWLSTDFIQTNIARPTFDTVGGRLMMVFQSTPELSWQLLAKDVLDRAGAAIALLLSAPLWMLACIGIKLSSPGPVLFRQERSGKNGKPFKMLKFRTMDVDAESRRDALAEENQMSGPVFKVEKDPRIFKFGALLRKFSIDEIPQFINVLLGHMSLVGPRPLPTYEVDQIEFTSQRRRLSMKPGLTCLWQISGRNKIKSFEDWVALDLKYIDNWSIGLDFRIIARTIPVVLLGWGAR